MLILTRHLDEEIVIVPGDGLSKNDRRITVKIVGVSGGIVKLGIAAPSSTTVHRAEIQGRVDADANDRRQ